MIEPLAIEFKKNQRAFRQLARRGIVALYELRNLKASQPHRLIGFELIIVRYQKAWHGDQWSYPERERYPGNEEFGHYAWSLPAQSRETAQLAFDQLASMPFGSVKQPIRKDDYIGWGKGGSLGFRTSIRTLLSLRPVPKSGKISNKTPESTHRATRDNPQTSETVLLASTVPQNANARQHLSDFNSSCQKSQPL